MNIRDATATDLPAIAAIYHYFVLNSTCTFETEPRSAGAWEEWLAEHRGAWPVIVAEEASEVLGWGSLSKWNNRCAYRYSTEDSVYVRRDCHGRGVGRAILTDLIARAKHHGHRNIVAQIADHQAASERLHASLGFRRVGCLERIGFKFDRWVDVVIWQLALAREDGPPDT